VQTTSRGWPGKKQLACGLRLRRGMSFRICLWPTGRQPFGPTNGRQTYYRTNTLLLVVLPAFWLPKHIYDTQPDSLSTVGESQPLWLTVGLYAIRL
jgi:hypothetical protein